MSPEVVGSDTEDGDIFRNRFKLAGGRKKAPLSPVAGETPPMQEAEEESDMEHDEEEDEDEDEQEKKTSLADKGKVAEEHAEQAAASGFSFDQKLDMVDCNLVSLLTQKCCKNLGCKAAPPQSTGDCWKRDSQVRFPALRGHHAL